MEWYEFIKLLIKVQKPKSLIEFTTGQKDLKKNISRMPLEMARLKNEDTLQSGNDSPMKENEEDFTF